MVGNLDIGKLITIVMLFLIGAFFFGDKIMFWYDHKEDMPLSLSKVIYTQNDFQKLSSKEQSGLLKEVASVCINKHHIDKLSCDDTSYWLAGSLEKKGVDTQMAISWMKPCSYACENGKFDPAVYEAMNPITGAKMDKKPEKSKGTKWIWEED
ncbi:MAG: hypothetical protein COA44_09895 [Arcobacter sp.]|nr:MAG: hypothetical protein COA44_09895 [Arcobacter sp.]